MDPLLSATSLHVAQRLIAREGISPDKSEPKVIGDALQRASSRVFGTLSDSLGDEGSAALLTRALARTEPSYPALKTIRRAGENTTRFDELDTTIEAHGVAAVTAAIEALLAALVDILIRLIGEDMALKLIDHDGQVSRRGSGAEAP